MVCIILTRVQVVTEILQRLVDAQSKSIDIVSEIEEESFDELSDQEKEEEYES